MGFFKDFKDDLSQAVNELLPDDVFTDSDDELLFRDEDVVNTLDDKNQLKDSESKSSNISDQERADKIDANVEAFLQKVKALDEGKDSDDEMGFKLDDIMTSDDEMLFTDSMDGDMDDAMDDDMDDAMSGAVDEAIEEIQEEVLSVDTDDLEIAEESLIDLSEETTLAPEIEDALDEQEEEFDLADIIDEKVEPLDLTDDIDEAEVENIISSIDNEEDKMITEIANEKEQIDDVVGLQEVKEERASVSSDVTVIGKNTIINGSISSGGSLEVYGKVEGDIDCGGKLTINGVVKGNSKAQEVFVNAKRLEGNVESTGSIKVGQGTVIIGDVSASAGVVAGAVKGQIDVSGAVILDSTAIVKGNIKAKSVQINNGAVVDGYCSLIYADVDLENVFDAE